MERVASLTLFQKAFMDHRNDTCNMLDSYMTSLAAQFRDITMEQADHRRCIQSLEERREWRNWSFYYKKRNFRMRRLQHSEENQPVRPRTFCTQSFYETSQT